MDSGFFDVLHHPGDDHLIAVADRVHIVFERALKELKCGLLRWPGGTVVSTCHWKQMPGTPVHVVWTREDSVRNGTYRPLTYHRLRGGLDAQGQPVAWLHQLLGAGDPGLVGRGDEVTYAHPADEVSAAGAVDILPRPWDCGPIPSPYGEAM